MIKATYIARLSTFDLDQVLKKFCRLLQLCWILPLWSASVAEQDRADGMRLGQRFRDIVEPSEVTKTARHDIASTCLMVSQSAVRRDIVSRWTSLTMKPDDNLLRLSRA